MSLLACGRERNTRSSAGTTPRRLPSRRACSSATRPTAKARKGAYAPAGQAATAGICWHPVSLHKGDIDAAAHQAIVEYESPVPLFASGTEAAEHGQADVPEPGADAGRLIHKISRIRTDLRTL
jgi:hypothetical protein